MASGDGSGLFVPIVGCGHTGTTLLAAMLGSHRACYTVPEETEVFRHASRADARWLVRLLQRIAQDWGASVLVEKTPLHVRYLRSLYGAFPGARAVGMVRDPRDVVPSLMHRGFPYQAALKRWVGDSGALYYAYCAQKAFVIRYEDLIAQPEAVLGSLCRYLGLAFDPAMLAVADNPQQWFRPDTRQQAGTLQVRRNAQIHQPLTDRRGVWRASLPAATERAIVDACQAFMTGFGYDPEIPPDAS